MVYNSWCVSLKGDISMLIQVIYNDDRRCGAVHSSRLDYLIRSGLLLAFRRENEWVLVEDDAAQGCVGDYESPERRTKRPAEIAR